MEKSVLNTREYIFLINNELEANNLYSIDVLLNSLDINDLIKFLSTYSKIYQMVEGNDKVKLDYYLSYLKNMIISQSLISSNKFNSLIKLSKNTSISVRPITAISFINRVNVIDIAASIIEQFKNSYNLYYKTYYKRQIFLNFVDGDVFPVSINEDNLLHLLGISTKTVRLNNETKRLVMKYQKDLKSVSILNSLYDASVYDDTGADCTNNPRRSDIITTQFGGKSKTELIPFDKMDCKTRLFIAKEPYTKTSIFVTLPDGVYLSNNLKDVNLVEISKCNITNNSNEVLSDDKIYLDNGDYIFMGYVYYNGVYVPKSLIACTKNNCSNYQSIFNGLKPNVVKSVEFVDDSDGGTNMCLFDTKEVLTFLRDVINDFPFFDFSELFAIIFPDENYEDVKKRIFKL